MRLNRSAPWGVEGAMRGPGVLLGLALCVGPLIPSLAAAQGTVAAEQADDEDGRKWIKHRIVFGETYADIEERYGVTKKEIQRWNKKRLGPKQHLIAGHTLSIYARRAPPPRERIEYVVLKGDTWSGIAKKFDIQQKNLRAWNKKVPKLRAGKTIKVWTNPGLDEEPVTSEAEGEVPSFSVRGGGYAQGRPNRGRLVNGVQLPESEYYTIRNPEHAWGTSHAVLVIQQAIAAFRVHGGFEGEILIADMSQKGGGRLRPHSSHQSGRDADIRLPKKSGVPRSKSPSADEIDWKQAWILVKEFIETGEVEYIFLEYGRQRRLAAAAKAAGESAEYLKKHLEYPRGVGAKGATVRHAKGHTIHIHVRVKCSKDAPACVSY